MNQTDYYSRNDLVNKIYAVILQYFNLIYTKKYWLK